MKKEELRSLWKERIQAYRESGLTARQWCAENGVSTHRLYYWLRRPNSAASAPASPSEWMRFDVTDGPEDKASLTIKVGVCEIEIKEPLNEKLLLDVIRVLESRC
ncbi:IS66 family insertion sequence element accessory protein TnpA [Bacillus thermotolerans]|uniref:IS66 family insertion sequence element accessory protein TnpB n=1 Tax=Bacillus thermotolerans TaxID=1221996 RepID=A0A0F5I7T2_BACTR|nr:hypothetical protein [Bacillus thermotolerans]KKB41124.1 hypothetical protein QY95_00831 [Bacillus thermotolerans]KKB41350.1 hypothetical protein QY95_00830 [Bacillus thermotolerans]